MQLEQLCDTVFVVCAVGKLLHSEVKGQHRFVKYANWCW